MEELIYLLPFDQYGVAITVAAIIIAIVVLAIALRLLKVPQKMMAIFICGLAMMAFFFFQTDGSRRIAPFQDLVHRQKQLDQQLLEKPLELDHAKLVHVKVRARSLTLTLVPDSSDLSDDTAQDLQHYAATYIAQYENSFCNILRLEQALPYRKNGQEFINMEFDHFQLIFRADGQTATMAIPVASCLAQSSLGHNQPLN